MSHQGEATIIVRIAYDSNKTARILGHEVESLGKIKINAKLLENKEAFLGLMIPQLEKLWESLKNGITDRNENGDSV